MHTSLFSVKSALPLFVLMVSLPVLAQEHVGTVTGTGETKAEAFSPAWK